MNRNYDENEMKFVNDTGSIALVLMLFLPPPGVLRKQTLQKL